MTFTGDVRIQENENGDLDMVYENGQPVMTDGFETCVQLAIFGEPNAQNGMTRSESEKFISTFPAVIRRATVSNETRENGRVAIEKALAFLVTEGAASSVVVTGKILSVYAIGWEINISSPTGATRFAINWEKGSLTAGFRRV
jgi:phage gp46-like protein